MSENVKHPNFRLELDLINDLIKIEDAWVKGKVIRAIPIGKKSLGELKEEVISTVLSYDLAPTESVMEHVNYFWSAFVEKELVGENSYTPSKQEEKRENDRILAKVIAKAFEDPQKAFDKIITNTNQDLAIEYATNYVKDNCVAKTVSKGDIDDIWVYEDGVYVQDGIIKIDKLLRHIMSDHYKPLLYSVALKRIKADTRISQEEFFREPPTDEVCVMNGILNIKTKVLRNFSQDEYWLNKINATYDPRKDCPGFVKFIREVLDEHYWPTIQELFGYCLYRDYNIPAVFFFTGTGRNGKSVLMNTLAHFLGEKNVTSTSPEELEKNSFAASELHGKLACLCNDAEGTAMTRSSIMKSLSGNDSISANVKFKASVRFKNYAKLIYAFNTAPSITDNTIGLSSRMFIVDFRAQFFDQREVDRKKETNTKRIIRVANRNLQQELISTDEMSGLLNYAIEGINNLLNRGYFENPIDNELQRKIIEIKSPEGMVTDFIERFIEYETNSRFMIVKNDFYKMLAIWGEKFNALPPVTDVVFKKMRQRGIPIVQFKPHNGLRQLRYMRWAFINPMRYDDNNNNCVALNMTEMISNIDLQYEELMNMNINQEGVRNRRETDMDLQASPQKVINELKNGAESYEELQDKLGCAENVLNNIITILKNKGDVYEFSPGKYRAI